MIECVIARVKDKNLPEILQQTSVRGGNSVMATPAQRGRDEEDCISKVLKNETEMFKPERKCLSQKEKKSIPLCREFVMKSSFVQRFNNK